MEATFFKWSSELAQWFEQNHNGAKELWIGLHKRVSGRIGITYAEALDQALCFGWIDGIRNSIDATSYAIRSSPRRPNSTWSAVNVKRATELKSLGMMRPSGLQAFDARGQRRSGEHRYQQGDPKLEDAHERLFRSNKDAWEFFQAQPPSYRRLASIWVTSAKREETRLRRLIALIEESGKGQRLPVVTGKSRSS